MEREAWQATVRGVAESRRRLKRLSMQAEQHCVVSTAAAAAKSLRLCPTLCDPIDGGPPGSPSLGFSRQEHWSGLPFPSPMHENGKYCYYPLFTDEKIEAR